MSEPKNKSASSRLSRKNTRQRILDCLVAARGQWVPAPVLGKIALAYTRNIHELRRSGLRIENRVETVVGSRHGFYRLVLGAVAPRGLAQCATRISGAGQPANKTESSSQPSLLDPGRKTPVVWRDPESEGRRA